MNSLNFRVTLRNIPEMCTIQAVAFNEGFEWSGEHKEFLIRNRKYIYFIYDSRWMVFLDEITSVRLHSQGFMCLEGIQLLMTNKMEK